MSSSRTRSGRSGLPDTESGELFVVATPIGNLGDMGQRALEVLGSVDFVAAEDTRRTRGLLTHFGISAGLMSLHRFNERKRAREVVARLKRGESCALLTDAGTPGLSDPGAILVDECLDAGIRVVPVPGPFAAAAALSASGFFADTFTFLGFPPAKRGRRKRLLEGLRDTEGPLVFYHPPRRVRRFLEELMAAFGNRRVFIARELTKLYEELLRCPIEDALKSAIVTRELGEYTIVVEGAAKGAEPGEVPLDRLEALIAEEGLSLKDAVAEVAEEFNLKRSRVYEEALKLKKRLEDEPG